MGCDSEDDVTALLAFGLLITCSGISRCFGAQFSVRLQTCGPFSSFFLSCPSTVWMSSQLSQQFWQT